MLMRMFFCSFSFYKYWSSSGPPWPCDGGQRVRWSGFDRKIGVQPVDHTHPTFWSSHSHVISAYLYTDPIISPPGFHQQNLTWNKCSCFRMIAGPHISSCYPSSSVHLTKVSILHWIVKVEICLSQWKLKSFYRYEKDWPMQIPRWPPLLATMPGKMWSAYEWSLKVTEAQTQHNTLSPAWIYLCFQNRYLFPHWYAVVFGNLQKKIHFRFWDIYLVFWDVYCIFWGLYLIRIQRVPWFLFTIYKCCRFRLLFADR